MANHKATLILDLASTVSLRRAGDMRVGDALATLRATMPKDSPDTLEAIVAYGVCYAASRKATLDRDATRSASGALPTTPYAPAHPSLAPVVEAFRSAIAPLMPTVRKPDVKPVPAPKAPAPKAPAPKAPAPKAPAPQSAAAKIAANEARMAEIQAALAAREVKAPKAPRKPRAPKAVDVDVSDLDAPVAPPVEVFTPGKGWSKPAAAPVNPLAGAFAKMSEAERAAVKALLGF